eukprot:SAG31_NODE_15794_length_738_cov_1.638498_2_plen_132_part_01
MISQIARTDRWLDDCCRPIEETLLQLQWCRVHAVSQLAGLLERSYPDVARDALAKALQSRGAEATITDDGAAAVSRRTGNTIWKQLSWDFLVAIDNPNYLSESLTELIICRVDTIASNLHTFCHEVPKAFFD